jgi:hypothetical protein
MRVNVGINPSDELMLSWDFNVEYRAVSAWQVVGRHPEGYPIVACVQSWRMKGATVYEDAVELSESLKRTHRNRILLNGDASGKNRTAQATDSMWKTVKEIFEKTFGNVTYIVPNSNPPVKDTIQCLNWALRLGLIQFNENERNVYNSLQAIKADKYGEIDKSIDYREGTSARTHDGDTARYAVWHYFKYDYPGATGGVFIV